MKLTLTDEALWLTFASIMRGAPQFDLKGNVYLLSQTVS